jgi:hypothetical protein
MSTDVWWDESQRKWLRWDARRNRWRPLYPWWRQPASWVVIATVAGAAVNQYHAARAWTPLQRAYFLSYAWSAAACSAGWSEGSYSLLHIPGRTGQIASAGDVATTTSPADAEPLRLSEAAVRAGARKLEWSRGRYPHAIVYDFLRLDVYGARTLSQLIVPAAQGALTVPLIACLLALVPRLWHLLRHLHRPRAPAVPAAVPDDSLASPSVEAPA